MSKKNDTNNQDAQASENLENLEVATIKADLVSIKNALHSVIELMQNENQNETETENAKQAEQETQQLASKIDALSSTMQDMQEKFKKLLETEETATPRAQILNGSADINNFI